MFDLLFHKFSYSSKKQWHTTFHHQNNALTVEHLRNVKDTLENCSGQVVRASDLQSEGLGFKSWPGHTKDFKNGTYCLCAWCSA
ncbi:hypothetical protein HOLleu_08287 [Holothuria leucospilota]|uniref:Uncharacterized protein n=1 Tax=Holothuria leucospilota TaxID=206669 RepID=A0A9Q1CIX7_HOLLE|nr:hypothetical protein HOLleu_08287 [Holothuria leucospilota]